MARLFAFTVAAMLIAVASALEAGNSTTSPAPTPSNKPFCLDCYRGFGITYTSLDRKKFKTSSADIAKFGAYLAAITADFFNSSSTTAYTASFFSSPTRLSGVKIMFNLKGKFVQEKNLPDNSLFRLSTGSINKNIQNAVSLLQSWGYTSSEINLNGDATVSWENAAKVAASANKGWIAGVVIAILVVIGALAYLYWHQQNKMKEPAPAGYNGYQNVQQAPQASYQQYGRNNNAAY